MKESFANPFIVRTVMVKIVMKLYKNGNEIMRNSATQIRKETGITYGSVVKALKELVEVDIIVKSKIDRRTHFYTFTEKGREIARNLWGLITKWDL